MQSTVTYESNIKLNSIPTLEFRLELQCVLQSSLNPACSCEGSLQAAHLCNWLNPLKFISWIFLSVIMVKLDYFKLVVLSLTKKNNKYIALQGLCEDWQGRNL